MKERTWYVGGNVNIYVSLKHSEERSGRWHKGQAVAR